MSHHVLLEDDDELEQTFSDTNPFAPQNTNAGQEDWRSKFGAFARRAGETVKQHAAKAAATAQVKIAEAKVKLNELVEPGPDEDLENLEISAPTGGRRVPVDWHARSSSGSSTGSNGPPPVPPRKVSPGTAPKKGYGGKVSAPGSPKSLSRAPSGSVTLSPSSSSGSIGAKTSSAAPNYAAMTRSSSGQLGARSPRPLVFGASLKIATCDANGQQIYKIPPIVSDTIALIMKKGLKEEGIFRIGGSHAALQDYKARYNAGEKIDLSKELDVNNVSGLLKMYLRELPEHLFTDHLLPLFMNAINDPNDGETVVASLLPMLPETNLLILKELFTLLTAIAANSSVNMMTAQNLGIIFTQCLNVNSAFFAYLMARPHLLNNASASTTEASTEKDLIQW